MDLPWKIKCVGSAQILRTGYLEKKLLQVTRPKDRLVYLFPNKITIMAMPQ